jgi:hypothetical protein
MPKWLRKGSQNEPKIDLGPPFWAKGPPTDPQDPHPNGSEGSDGLQAGFKEPSQVQKAPQAHPQRVKIEPKIVQRIVQANRSVQISHKLSESVSRVV